MNNWITLVGVLIIYSISLILFTLVSASAYIMDKCDNDYHINLLNGARIVCYVDE